MKLGIIGNGFVGSAVAHGFEIDTEQFIVDPKFNENTIQDLVNWDAEITFVCVPTPQQDSHLDVDTHIARNVLKELHELEYKGVVVV
jgi:UDP-N-acetyl-D-mannosaminuronate dehydrogenase